MQQPQNQEKQSYTKPELVTHEPLRDLTATMSGMTQIDPPSLQID